VRALRAALQEHHSLLTRAVADLQVQFKRIAQMQVELDDLRKLARRSR
jgi:hypothetical protein